MANGKILEKKLLENIWIQPAAGDAGGSFGCKLKHFNSIELKKKEKENTNQIK